MPAEAGSEHQRLAVLVGRWKTQGTTRPSPDAPAVTIDATDTYEWLPGRRGLLHIVDAWMGEEHVEGAEILGWDPDRKSYVTLYFGTDGPGSYQASLEEDGDTNVWRMRSESERFTGRFSPDGATIDGHWECTENGTDWVPWMDITLSKREDPSR
jgi:hypothetical protein